ncbi:unnamed protein product, partial [Cuscuta campestris]
TIHRNKWVDTETIDVNARLMVVKTS